MTFRMDLNLIDELLRLEQTSSHFHKLLQQSSLLVLISHFLTIRDLVQFLKVNSKTHDLARMPVLEVRLLKGHLRKIRNGDVQEVYNIPIEEGLQRFVLPRSIWHMGITRKVVGLKELISLSAAKPKQKKGRKTSFEKKPAQNQDFSPSRISQKIATLQLMPKLPKPIVQKHRRVPPKQQKYTIITEEATYIGLQPREGQGTFSVIKEEIISKIPFFDFNEPAPQPNPHRLAMVQRMIEQQNRNAQPTVFESAINKVSSLFYPRSV